MRAQEFITEARTKLSPEVTRFLNSLTPIDVGVDDVGRYRIRYEGFSDDCKTSSDYQKNPEKVFMEVWRDFIQREGNRAPINYGIVGTEDNPILYAVFDRGMRENFADKKVKGRSRPGRVKRAGASCAGSVTDLRARAKKYGGEKGKMYHWCANMKSGKKKK